MNHESVVLWLFAQVVETRELMVGGVQFRVPSFLPAGCGCGSGCGSVGKQLVLAYRCGSSPQVPM